MKNLRAIGAGLGIVLTAALIAGCGGGSQNAGNVATGGTATTTVVPAQNVPTAPLTVTITIPSAATSAESLRRSPTYISPNTRSIVAYALPSNTYGSNSCSGTTCTVTLAAPLTTTSIEVLLYSAGNALLSETTQPVTITAGTANTPALIFNGVASYFTTTISPAQAVIGVAQSFVVTLTPFDASGAQISGPGSIVDIPGDVLISASGSTQTFSLAKSGTDSQYLTLGTLAWNSTNYTLTATASYSDGGSGTSGTITITPSTSVSYFQNAAAPAPLSLPVNPKSIQIVANPAHTPSGYQVTLGALTANTSTALELGAYPSPNPVAVYLSVISNFNDAGAHFKLSDSGCSTLSNNDPGLNAAFPSPGPTMPATLSYNFTYSPTGPIPSPGPGTNVTCAFTITDTTNNLMATANVGLDDTTLTISGKARK